MTKIITLLERLKGRLKKMEEQIMLALGAVCVATGLIAEIEYTDMPFLWVILVVGAAFFWFLAIRAARVREKMQRRLREIEVEKLFGLLANINKELQKLNEKSKNGL
jgi:membrane protein implicated in regulation of membrane protease activity